MEHFSQIITSHPLLRQRNQLVGCGRKVKIQNLNHMGSHRHFWHNMNLKNIIKKKSTPGNRFMGWKCPFALKKTSGNRFSLYFGQHNVLSFVSRKFKLDEPAMKENNCHIFMSLVSMQYFLNWEYFMPGINYHFISIECQC